MKFDTALIQTERENEMISRTNIGPYLTLFFLLFGLWICSASAAQNLLNLEPDELTYLQNHPTLKLCVDPNWAPYEKLEEDGEYVGIVAEYLSLFESRLGIKFDILKTNSWKETQTQYREKKCDIVSALNKTPERTEYLDFTQPYFSSPAVLAVNEETPGISLLSDLNGKSLAMVAGYVYEEKLRQQYPEINIKHVPSMEDALKMVSTKETVATLGPLFLTYVLMDEGKLNNLTMIGNTGYQDELRIGVPKSQPILVSIFDRVIASLTQVDHEMVRINWSRSRK